MTNYKSVYGSVYEYEASIGENLQVLQNNVRELRTVGRLSPKVLRTLRDFFRVKNIYHSNAIEGNLLNIGETRLVVEQGLTITGKPLKDTLEAKNLSHALSLFETLADREGLPIAEVDIRALHAAILKGIDDGNAGTYRSSEVEISGSRFKPPSPHEIAPKMQEFGEWLKLISLPTTHEIQEDPITLAAVAHTWFVSIHPFIDGNGRTARLLMNLILMRYGYPIAVITREDRQRYYDALEESQSCNLTPFVGLVYESVTESLEEYQQAAQQQRENDEWARSVVNSMSGKQLKRYENEYDIWRSAMDLLKGHFKQTVDLLNEHADTMGAVRLFFKDFGILEFEKYASLRNGKSTKQTWFFRVDFSTEDVTRRFLFFFGHISTGLRSQLGDTVTLFSSHELSPYYYERLEITTDLNAPTITELAYLPDEEQFMCRHKNGRLERGRIEKFVKLFIEQVVRLF